MNTTFGLEPVSAWALRQPARQPDTNPANGPRTAIQPRDDRWLDLLVDLKRIRENPAILGDDYREVTPLSLEKAFELGLEMYHAGVPAPDFSVPFDYSGWVFEWRADEPGIPVTAKIQISPEASLEYLLVRQGRVETHAFDMLMHR